MKAINGLYDLLRKRRERASAMTISLVMLSILSFSAVSFLYFQVSMGKMTKRRREQLRAFYVAEAGVHSVVHWFNHPHDYTPDTDQFAKYQLTESYYDAQGNSKFTSVIEVPDYMLPSFEDENGKHFGDILSLTIYPPSDSDPVPSLCKIESVGETINGNQKTVIMFVNANQGLVIQSPAAILSEAAAAWNGQINVHWGEAWAKDDVYLPNKPHVQERVRNDPWYKILTEENLLLGKNKYADGTWKGSRTPLPPSASNYYVPWGENSDYNVLRQHQTLDFPQFPYEEWKELAQKRGRYYSTDSNGNIYKDGIEDNAHLVNYEQEFGGNDDGNDPYDVIFIDTTDGNPPEDDGSNLATIRLSGDTPQTKGFFYINANVFWGGSGSPPNAQVMKPDMTEVTLDKVRHVGMYVVSGWMDQQGQNTIYGSMLAKDGFGSGGCPEIYYDFRLRDGKVLDIASKVTVRLWKSY